MPQPPALALFQGGPLDGLVAPVAEAGAWFCPRHAVPVPVELAAILASQPAAACLAYRRHAAALGRAVYRFEVARHGTVTDACRRLPASWRADQ